MRALDLDDTASAYHALTQIGSKKAGLKIVPRQEQEGAIVCYCSGELNRQYLRGDQNPYNPITVAGLNQDIIDSSARLANLECVFDLHWRVELSKAEIRGRGYDLAIVDIAAQGAKGMLEEVQRQVDGGANPAKYVLLYNPVNVLYAPKEPGFEPSMRRRQLSPGSNEYRVREILDRRNRKRTYATDPPISQSMKIARDLGINLVKAEPNGVLAEENSRKLIRIIKEVI